MYQTGCLLSIYSVLEWKDKFIHGAHLETLCEALGLQMPHMLVRGDRQ